MRCCKLRAQGDPGGGSSRGAFCLDGLGTIECVGGGWLRPFKLDYTLIDIFAVGECGVLSQRNFLVLYFGHGTFAMTKCKSPL